MRPTKIIISAFGPYASKTEIDMEKLGRSGIYLITGDTGAGKTTIFDAITFALFGEASGSSRESSMFRSKYAEADCETFVELEFSYGGESYKLRRSPEYERPAKRGNGMTKQMAQAELTLSDGKVVTKTKEVNQAVREILGIDRNQFSQIVMIAQGDFLKLLLAPTEERKKIFRQIFKTEYYNILQERLKQESGTASKNYEAIKSSIAQYVAGVRQADGANFVENPERELLEQIDELIVFDRLLKSTNDEKIKLLDEEIIVQNSKLIKIEEQIKIKAKLAVSKISLATAESALEEAQKSGEKIQSLQNQAELKLGEVAKLEEKLSQYDELDKLQSELASCKKQSDVAEKSLKDSELEQNKLSVEIADLKAKLEQIGDISLEKQDYVNQIEKLETQTTSVTELKDELSALLEKQEEYKKELARAEALQSEYIEKNRKFLNEQAGVLAEGLAQGESCPVCGSTEHPNPATLTEGAPTRAEVKKASELSKLQNDKTALISVSAGQLIGSVSAKCVALGFIYGEVDLDAKLDAFCTELCKKLEKCKERAKTLDEIAREKCEIERILPQKQSKNEGLVAKKSEFFAQLSVNMEKTTYLSQSLERQKSELAQPNKASALSELEAKTREHSAIKGEINKLETALNSAKSDHDKISAETKMLAEQIDEKAGENAEHERKQLAEMQSAKREITAETEQINARLTVNEEALSMLISKQNELKKAENHWIFIKSLTNTANGNISGKEKIALETYIQMTYFDRIIRRANLRFRDMTNGQYELRRRQESSGNRSQSGLELDVIDYHNGTIRSVKTLSGGESFKASLSLAFGLSEEIQSTSGGIKIEAMFVDEGFGSLDEESLKSSVKVLQELTYNDRIIGIISHVSELKEKISSQIQVRKNPSGGSEVTIICD